MKPTETPEYISQFWDHIAVAVAGMEPAVTKKLQELRDTLKEVNAKLDAAGGLDKATAQAQRIVAEAREEAEALLDEAAQRAKDLDARESGIAQREATMSAAEGKLRNDINSFNGQAAGLKKALADQQQSLDVRGAALTQRAGDLDRQASALAARVAEADKKLERLRQAMTG